MNLAFAIVGRVWFFLAQFNHGNYVAAKIDNFIGTYC